ncbi:MAG: type IV pilus modification PilV family protein [Armatimonadota bacterium]
MRYAGRHRHRGLTLVELLVAVLILSLALVSLSQLYLAGMWTTQKARYMSIATKRAQAELERAQDLGLLTLRNGPSEDSYPAAIYTHHENGMGVDFTAPPLPNGTGSVTWDYWPPNTSGNEYLLKVNVNITWEGARRSRSQVILSTLLTNRR